LLLATVLLGVSALSAQEPFTLEQILSSPFPYGMVAAPNHGKIAWVQNAEGRRNIWVAVAPDYEARQITQYDEDDGQAISNLEFGPGGNHIVFVRGGPPNRDGEIPNPLSDPEGTAEAIWIIEPAGGEPRKLAEGSSPAISPDGEKVAFLQEGQIWSVPAVDEGEATQLARTRGEARSLRWSPDGSMLAFVSRRQDHSFVGVYDFSQSMLRYLDPSVSWDRYPVWSPDGSQVAFIRMPNERQRLPFAPRRMALPWSVRVADASTGHGRAVWIADEGPGSAFRAVVAENQLWWAAGNRLVFPWEKDGWTHLYSVPANVGQATLLTPGAFEVEDVSLSPDGTEVVFSSNQEDVDRRHLWRVPVEGGSAAAVTSGRGVEWSPVMTGDGKAIAYLASDARTPAHAVIEVGSEKPRALISLPNDFPTAALVEPQPVIFSGADGLKIHGQLFLPENTGAERHPAVLFFHGGSRRQMLLGWHYRGYYHNAYALNQYLASRGYVVLSVNFRSGIGYGMEFREAALPSGVVPMAVTSPRSASLAHRISLRQESISTASTIGTS
jgi:Tol biopolymer transport system component